MLQYLYTQYPDFWTSGYRVWLNIQSSETGYHCNNIKETNNHNVTNCLSIFLFLFNYFNVNFLSPFPTTLSHKKILLFFQFDGKTMLNWRNVLFVCKAKKHIKYRKIRLFSKQVELVSSSDTSINRYRLLVAMYCFPTLPNFWLRKAVPWNQT